MPIRLQFKCRYYGAYAYGLLYRVREDPRLGAADIRSLIPRPVLRIGPRATESRARRS